MLPIERAISLLNGLACDRDFFGFTGTINHFAIVKMLSRGSPIMMASSKVVQSRLSFSHQLI
jgi:hypothetical protein